MAKFRTKPFEIEAVQFTGDNEQELYGFCGWEFAVLPEKFHGTHTAQVHVKHHNVWAMVKPGDWIVRGQDDEFYPCDPEIFEAKYEAVDE